ncbi:DUF2283 domain-containing protein [Trichothermofontia sichuanensis B231]|uniref:DUF2283 domain-containing protein n=1 Tax=Leptolyngbyales TaxID=3079749 RepID=UPI001CA68995|nr:MULTISPECIES: DUF2283 domain-containing protein [Leptolyngbyales]QZZ22883.1 DUF2283 domain-containing protein [Leptothermofonsia sichuanensis E412]UZQ53336.1 DUF2283 domain-containing protein [Trichothermofontia sichuanensis B231]
MAENLTFQYDREGDILYINRCAPYTEQESEELGDDVIARLNPQTGEIENLEVLFFSQRLQDKKFLDLPITVNFSLAVS